MFRLGIILILITMSLFAYSNDEKLTLNPNVFKVIKKNETEYITLRTAFQHNIVGESGVLKGIIIGGISDDSIFILTKVDEYRYQSGFNKLIEQTNNYPSNETLIVNFSPSLDLNFKYKFSQFSLLNTKLNGFLIAGKNKRDLNQNVYEMYFVNNGGLFSLTYFTNLSFEQVFT